MRSNLGGRVVKVGTALVLSVVAFGVPAAVGYASSADIAHRPGWKCWPDAIGGHVVFVQVENDSVIVVDGRPVVIHGATYEPVVVGSTPLPACGPDRSH